MILRWGSRGFSCLFRDGLMSVMILSLRLRNGLSVFGAQSGVLYHNRRGGFSFRGRRWTIASSTLSLWSYSVVVIDTLLHPARS